MANMLFANNCNTTLSGSLTNVATTMSVTSATGFPSPTGSEYFYCTLADAATQTTIEIVKVTAVSGTTFTITRGQDGTTGTAFSSGAVVSLRLVRANLNDFPKLDEANTFTQAQTFSALTSGRIPYSTTGGLQTDSASLTFDGTTLQNSNSIVTGRSGGTDGSFVLKRASDGVTVGNLSLNASTGLLALSTAYSYLTFSTQSAEIARFDGSGNFLLGTTTNNGIGMSLHSGANPYGYINTSATSNTPMFFAYNGTTVGTISNTTTTTFYNVTSDKRLKDEIGISTSTDVIDNTIIYDYSWKANGLIDKGVFAQEAKLVKPIAVFEGTDEIGKNGLPTNPWQVDYSKYVPDLIVYCQQLKKQSEEQQTIIEDMQSRLKNAGILGFNI